MAANQLTEFMREHPFEGFHPHPFYSKEGDFLTYFFRGDNAAAHRVDDILTIYLSIENEELVGLKIKGVRHLIETVGAFYREYHDDDGFMLSLLLWAGATETSDQDAKKQYKELGERTRAVRVRPRELAIA